MATLILNAVGTAIGGPVGGAIGSLIGYSIDQQIFGGGPRKGPRLGDLSVQTSTYGTLIPRIYGTMRVAGSVVWATDLKETSVRQGGGKGQPEIVAYNYSVSLAIALSSRRAESIGRIWADGKLLRGAAGDFKVRTRFRFHSGSEDQPLDPLIASIEGIARTPAYRGLALAIFEDLELAEFGNRIPFLTFELIGDPAEPEVGTIIGDASSGAIACTDSRTMIGYAAHGANVRSALQPLIDHFDVALIDDGSAMRSPAPDSYVIGERHLGCSADGSRVARIELTQTPAREVPSSLAVSYYDPDRDYQTGSMRASTGRSEGPREQLDAPIVLRSAEAKALAETSLARRWARRDRLTLRVSPIFATAPPGSLVQVQGQAGTWRLERATVEGFVTILELSRIESPSGNLPSDPGRNLPDDDRIAAATSLALLDLPDPGTGRGTPLLHLAAANASKGWRAVPIEIAMSGAIISSQTAFAEAVMGTSITALGQGQPWLFDTHNSIEVELVDEAHWLESREDSALVDGANLAAIGDELFQFGLAEPIGSKRFRLSRLLRGRRGTEWAMVSHAAGERFVVLHPSALRAIEVPQAMIGANVEVTAFGVADGAGTKVSRVARADAQRPLSPVRLRGELTGQGISLSWIRRSRDGFGWLDGIDAPIGESEERYRVRITGSAGSIEREVTSTEASFSAAEIETVGVGPAWISVVQLGDLAQSRPAELPIEIQ